MVKELLRQGNEKVKINDYDVIGAACAPHDSELIRIVWCTGNWDSSY